MASRSIKQALVAGAAALVIGGAALGVASAQQSPASFTAPAQAAGRQAPPASGLSFPVSAATPGAQDGPREQQEQKFLDALAAKLGISTDKLKQAIDEVRQEQGLPPGGIGGGHRGGPHGMGMGLDAAATAIGITPEQLHEELTGKTLTDVANAHNVDPSKVAAALKADAIKRIDQAVTDGKLTSDQATQMKSDLDAKIQEMMTRTFQEGGPDGHPHGGPGGPGGSGGQGEGFAPRGGADQGSL